MKSFAAPQIIKLNQVELTLVSWTKTKEALDLHVFTLDLEYKTIRLGHPDLTLNLRGIESDIEKSLEMMGAEIVR